jgi:hypothetical protein
MFDNLFGSAMPLPAKFFIAFMVVLVLIGLTAWLVRRFGAARLGAGAARGRQPRLAVIDSASVDGRRRLVLIRRDNVEHLLMIGGPTDVVVEPNIVRAAAAREPTRTVVSGDTLSRTATLDAGAWPLQPAPESAPAPAMRPYRSTLADEPWLPPGEPGTRQRPPANSLTSLAAELSTRLSTQSEPATSPRRTPRHEEPARADHAAATAAERDSNLAEMAQRLEAALRSPPPSDGHPPVTDPLAASLAVPPPPEQAAAPARSEFADSLRAPAGEPKPARPDAKVAAKHIYDNLEQEMASLLGRPTNKP